MTLTPTSPQPAPATPPGAPGPHTPPDVLTTDELASWLQVDAEAITELAEQGELPGRKLAGEWRFAREAVLDWLARR